MDFTADFIEENGYSPSYEEMAQGLKLASLATVHKHVQALESRNYVRRLFNQSRSLEARFDSALASYQAGKTTFDSVLGALQTYLMLNVDYYDFVRQQLVAQARLEAIQGGAR